MENTLPEVAEFASALRHLKDHNGQPTLKSIHRHTPSRISISTLSRMFSGKAVPTWPVLTEVLSLLHQGDETSAQLVAVIHARYQRARLAQRGKFEPHPLSRSQHVAPETDDLQKLQQGLRDLMASAGLTLRLVAERTGVPKSTIFDGINQKPPRSRPPRPDVVAAIAHACGAEDPESWYRVAERMHDTPKPANTRARTDQSVTLDPFDAVIKAAVTRPGDEIAELAISFKEGGREDLAARLIEAVAKSSSVQEVAAITIALLNHSSPHKESAAETSHPQPETPTYPPEAPAPLPATPNPPLGVYGPPPEMPARPRQEPGRLARLLRALTLDPSL
ncbi:helix-turn-helix domain-containing protein [Streptomyces sp. NBC_01551]|uniref:helix-turn-helix domain-containing protein n=1 Tax=Streptomyces sp. NBC_01551 TaxID=2975876 RepID=UPI0022553E6E|nr:helix-turn-helix transcriptional regulator [Streptomyces sp. NBC_01551]MCX4529905.1 helix-turn-helix domain-containing protein [Streptomyces sp. NBC_01551]